MPERFDDQFERNLSSAAGELAAAKGPCPDGKAFVSHLLGGASTEDESRIRIHLRRCGKCTAVEFRFQQHRQRQRRRIAIGALALIAIAIGAAITLRSPRVQYGEIAAAEVLYLDTVRGAPKPQGESSSVVALSFFIPIESPGRWKATLRDREGRVVMENGGLRSYDGKGNFLLVLSRTSLVPGRYQLNMIQPPHRHEFSIDF